MSSTFRVARDQLLKLRGKHEEAVRTFAFPDMGPRWNWAIDWFDSSPEHLAPFQRVRPLVVLGVVR